VFDGNVIMLLLHL